jgi:transposase
MPKTIKLEPHLSSEELERRYRKAKDPVLRSHYQIVWLISEGKTTRQVMEVTGYSRGWIQQLARRYNALGAEALGDRRHHNPGAKERALLTADQQQELKEALLKPPPDGGMWNSPKVGEWIERRTGKVLTQKKQRGWEYMRKLGNSPKVPRPRHKQANKAEQEAFKKALDEGIEAQGELPNGEGRAVVRGRAPLGSQADLPQGVESHWSEAAG